MIKEIGGKLYECTEINIEEYKLSLEEQKKSTENKLLELKTLN